MSKATRALTIAGLALVAGTTLGAGPAVAAAPTTRGAQATTTVAHRTDWDRDRVVGYFYSRRVCERVGRIGEIRDTWDDYYCSFEPRGFRGRSWELTAQYDRRGHHDGPWGDDHRGGDNDHRGDRDHRGGGDDGDHRGGDDNGDHRGGGDGPRKRI